MERIGNRPPSSSRPQGCRAWLAWMIRLGFLLSVLSLVFVAAWLFILKANSFGGTTTLIIGGRQMTVEPNSELNVAERAYLRGFLTLHSAAILEPAGPNQSPQLFTVYQGESASEIAERLEKSQLVTDATLFRYYLRYYDLDAGLEAGQFTLKQSMTLPEIAQTLSHAMADEIELRITEGWRLEQTVEFLTDHPELGISPDEFLLIAKRERLDGSSNVGEGSNLEAIQQELDVLIGGLPIGASFEGYLFPDTYRLPADSTAADLVETMLFTFNQRVTDDIRQAMAAQGLTLHGAVTLASIVEREAQLAEERPLIASVFLNRLAQGMKLEADPSVQYALGFQQDSGQWWKRPLTLLDLEIESPYNTYRNVGLPPGPIASPGLASLQAVAYPAETNYLFFVADCTAENPGAHIFAETFQEHQINVAKCR